MHTVADTGAAREVRIKARDPLTRREVKSPLAERLLVRFPKVASILTSVGARNVPRGAVEERGRLAAMMTASGSIDFGGAHPRSYRFHIRPMC